MVTVFTNEFVYKEKIYFYSKSNGTVKMHAPNTVKTQTILTIEN